MGRVLPEYFPVSIDEKIKTLSINKNDCLFRVGDNVEYLFFIVEGEIRAVRYHIDGTESIMVRASAGEFFAESGIATEQYVCDAIATGKTKLAAIPIDDVRELLGSPGEFSLAFGMSMAKMIRKQCSRYERLRLNKARDRIVHFLICESDQNKQVKIETTLGGWANEMGLEPETLYRTLKELEDDNLIVRNKKHIRLNVQ